MAWQTGFTTSEEKKSLLCFSTDLSDLIESCLTAGYVREANHIIVTDRTVAALYLEEVKGLFINAGFNVSCIVLEAGEQVKSLPKLQALCEKLLALSPSKDSNIVVLGGGVVANVAGLCASILLRGINLTLIPTTILSQSDSAIDIKHAVNSSLGKNTIGSLYPPKLVFINPNFTRTLPLREIRSGLAEIAKHALIESRDLYELLLAMPRLGSAEFFASWLPQAIQSTIRLKLAFLRPSDSFLCPDWKDMGPQYGHAFGHAIEQIMNYSFTHGEAISVGMQLSAELSYLLGYCSEDTITAHKQLLGMLGLPTELPLSIPLNGLIAQTLRDKYAQLGTVLMALPSDIGECHIENNRTGVPVGAKLLEHVLSNHRARTLKEQRKAA